MAYIREEQRFNVKYFNVLLFSLGDIRFKIAFERKPPGPDFVEVRYFDHYHKNLSSNVNLAKVFGDMLEVTSIMVNSILRYINSAAKSL